MAAFYETGYPCAAPAAGAESWTQPVTPYYRKK